MGYSEDLAEGLQYIGLPTRGMNVPLEIDTPAERDALHDRNVEHLTAYARARAVHLRHVPDCDAAPDCPGPAVGAALMFRAGIQPGYGESLLYTALTVICERDAEIADLRARLMGMDADLVDARGNLADTERQLFEARSRLAACDDLLADAVPPVLPVEGS